MKANGSPPSGSRMRHDTPRDDVSLAAELRRQLDEALGRHGELERQVGRAGARVKELEGVVGEVQAERAALSARLLGEAEAAERAGEMPKQRGSAWWFAAWREIKRQLGAKSIELAKLEQELLKRSQWLKEYGEQLALAQTHGALLQRIVDTVRGHEPTDTLGAVKVHHPDGGSAAWLFDAIDAVTKGPAT